MLPNNIQFGTFPPKLPDKIGFDQYFDKTNWVYVSNYIPKK